MGLAELEEYYHRLCGLQNGERQQLLAEVHARNPLLAQQLRELLETAGTLGDFLAEPILPEHLQPLRFLQEWVPILEGQERHRIGPFRLTGISGIGGMGIVYEAVHEEQYDKVVAVKVIREERSSEKFLELFETERETLAKLEHEHIAHFLHAGMTEDGHPFLAMEHVDGLTLMKYCESCRLPLFERINLFFQICDGIAHAHNLRIIHGDLKPSNIMVVTRPEGPKIKIIDFGIATLTDQMSKSSNRELMGSPAYMSPQQAEKGTTLDFKSDVYGLGAILFELIAGCPPLDPTEYDGKTDLRNGLQTGVRHRLLDILTPERAPILRLPFKTLRRMVRTDLHWIVAKALALDPEQRYQTTVQLKEELQRFLVNEPVIAARTTRRYLIHKWVQRHRVATIGGLALAVGVIVALFGLSIALNRAHLSRKTLQTLSKTHDLYNQIVQTPQPSQHGPDLKFIDGLALWESQLKLINDADPQQIANLHMTFGNTCYSLGIYDRALSHFERATQLRRGIFPKEDLALLSAQERLARVQWQLQNHEEARAGLVTIIEHAPEDSIIALRAQCSLVGLRLQAGEVAALQPAINRLRERHIRLAPNNPERFVIKGVFASYEDHRGNTKVAATIRAQILEGQQQFFGPNHPQTLLTKSNLAEQAWSDGRYQVALAMYQELAIAREITIGKLHPYTLRSKHGVGRCLNQMGRYREAYQLLKDVVNQLELVFNRHHPRVLEVINSFAILVGKVEGYAAAITIYRDLAERYRIIGQLNSVDGSRSLNNLAHHLRLEGQPEAALEAIDEALALTWSVDSPGHTSALNARITRAEILGDLNRMDEAGMLYDEVLNLARLHHSDTATLGIYLTCAGLFQLDQNDLSQAKLLMWEAFTVLDDTSQFKRMVARRWLANEILAKDQTRKTSIQTYLSNFAESN